MKVKLICDMHNKNITEVDEERYEKLVENNAEYIGKELYAKIDRPHILINTEV